MGGCLRVFEGLSLLREMNLVLHGHKVTERDRCAEQFTGKLPDATQLPETFLKDEPGWQGGESPTQCPTRLAVLQDPFKRDTPQCHLSDLRTSKDD